MFLGLAELCLVRIFLSAYGLKPLFFHFPGCFQAQAQFKRTAEMGSFADIGHADRTRRVRGWRREDGKLKSVMLLVGFAYVVAGI